MSKFARIAAAAGSLMVATVVGYAAPAAAQATRTWVSGVGDDANPCSRTAPCKTFAGSISKTATGGEINCIDSGAYGAVTIVKAISIICDDVEAGVLATGTNGITLNLPAGANVFLSGLDIEGAGSGVNGIRFLGLGTVQVRNTTIRNFGLGYGVSYTPSGNGTNLVLDNVVLSGNGSVANPTTSGAINLNPPANVIGVATITNTQLANNQNVGIRIDSTGVTGSAISATIADSKILNSGTGILVKMPAGAGTAKVLVFDSRISQNATIGIIVNTGTASAIDARVSGSTITGNGVGVQLNGVATLKSYGNNVLTGNTTDGAFTPPNLPLN